MSQAVRLLKAQCVSCKGFRLNRNALNRVYCKLRLLQYGCVREAGLIDAIGEDFEGLELPEVPIGYSSEAEEEGKPLADSVVKAREALVARTLRRCKNNPTNIRNGKNEGASEMRRSVITEFFTDLQKKRQCETCGVISPAYRVDRSVKIFEKPLSGKDKAKMRQKNFRMKDVMATEKRMFEADEGIADIDLSSNEDAESEEDTHRASKAQQKLIHPMEVLARLNKLFETEQDLLALLYNSRSLRKKSEPLTADMFFINTLLVPPTRFRPETRRGAERPDEAQDNSLYKAILQSSAKIVLIYKAMQGDSGPRRRDVSSLHEAWIELQDAVNSLIDMTKNPAKGAAAKRSAPGIKQNLEKKEGLFRNNMMGKRVNYAARSVISPDPNIETNEIGVPPVFATKLTYPEPVTSHNFREMKQAVINGVEKWPGATAIENENGSLVYLRGKSIDDRMALANQLLAPTNSSFSNTRNKKVHRHITNGDVVLMNRQPTLHKPSIMGHRVKVLPGEKTIRMHYANCNTYNADFDGDEMNMHFPQNEIARAEALQIADTDHQYISGTQGKPLRGLIQDHLSVCVELCNRDAFFDRSAYQQLIYNALRPESGHILGERIALLPPAVLRPVRRWTGKQVISTILKNITPPDCGGLWMDGKTQIKGDRWAPGSEEDTVAFRDGEFISGILDKSQLGPSSGGFIHAIHEVYGPTSAGKLLSSLGRLLTRYLNMRAFTCGMDDLRLTTDGEQIRKEKLKAARDIGLEVATKYVTLDDKDPSVNDPELLSRLEEVLRDDSKQEGLDLLMNARSAELSTNITNACLPGGLEKEFPKNHMQLMTISGAKGGSVNANLISCNLGQQVLEGRRVPLMVSGKSLPCFDPFDTNVRAGGYIINRFLTGIRPQEYYFHHMAGREGLIDTAVKTSRSGYLQRCVVKGMEGLIIAYDLTVRDADGGLVQFLYGEDGIAVESSRYLTDFGFILRNATSEVARLNFGQSAHRVLQEKEEIAKHQKKAIRRAKANDHNAKDPINSLLHPGQYAFATSERFFDAMTQYLKENKDGLFRDKDKTGETMAPSGHLSRKTAEQILALKHFKSMAEPGEAVGVVAGHSVGEPSTQMTLNTFHLAGHSAKNVTLGIPRLREILMTSGKNISTPSMTLYMNEELGPEDGKKFAKAISILPLAHVLDRVKVKERVGRGRGHALAKMFNIHLKFFPSDEYRAEYAIEISDVMDAVEKFMKILVDTIKKEIKKRSGGEAAAPDVGESSGRVQMVSGREPGLDDDGPGMDGRDEGNDEEDDDGDDGDATTAKQRANRSGDVSYGENDEEDDIIEKEMERAAGIDANDDEPEDEGFGGSQPSGGEDEGENEAGDLRGGNRAERLMEKHNALMSFVYDKARGEWCEFTLEYDSGIPKMLVLNMVQKAVKMSVVQQIRGVGACHFVPDEKSKDSNGKETKEAVVHTAGVNLQAVQQFGDIINPNRIMTNDSLAILAAYGIEACRNSIIVELDSVFGSHGIKVDSRHLNLIADHMTRTGTYAPFTRHSLSSNPSPFTKMSFETTLAFLRDAVIDGDWDDLTSPSSRIVMGKLGKAGTGAFGVITMAPTHHATSMR
jgi:DNA-directed RNA polymerase I subunit RPA1